MATDFAPIIKSYRERCARLLQDAKPNSAEHYAASQMLLVFDMDQSTPANQRVMPIIAALDNYSHTLSALDLAPPETHAMARAARAIVSQWLQDFKRELGVS